MRPEGDLPGTEPVDEVDATLCNCWLGDANGECPGRPAEEACAVGPEEAEEASEAAPPDNCLVWFDPWLRIRVAPTTFASSPSWMSRGTACSGEAKGEAMWV